MIVENFFDLQIACFDHEEVISEDILRLSNFDIIRIHEPTASQCETFLPLGFVYKPSWLFWLKPVYDSVDAYLSSFERHARDLIRYSIKRIEAVCQIRVDLQLDPKLFDYWLSLYQKRMAELPYGVDCASEDRDKFLSEPEKYVGVFVFHANRLIAGGICLRMPDYSMLRLTYYASDSSFRHLDLSRYVYFVIANITRELGYQTLSAGADPNFYGYDVSTGLYLFKKRLGFQAEPKGKYGSPSANVLEKVISLAKCKDPCFCLGYADPNLTSDQLVGHVFSYQTDPDVSSFRASFLKQIYCHYVGE